MTERKITQPEKKTGGRMLTLDAARGLAVIGMYIQHFALNERNSFVSGNTMILFMLCSGISYTLMGRKMTAGEETAGRFRTRVLARALFIDLAGYFLILLNGPFGAVLTAYAMLFLGAMVLVRRSERTLGITAALLFLAAPPLMIVGLSLFADAALFADLAGGPLSALAWSPVFVLGMLLGRLDLRRTKTAVRLIGTGAAMLIPVKLFVLVVLPGVLEFVAERMQQIPPREIDPYAVWPRNTESVMWHYLFVDMPQGGSFFELMIGAGGSLILLGILLLLERKLAAVFRILACSGRNALTLYVFQFLLAWAVAIAGGDVTGWGIGDFFPGDILVAAAVVLFGCFLARWENGPFEGWMRRFERLFTA